MNLTKSDHTQINLLFFSYFQPGEKRVQREDYITHYHDQAPIDMEMRRYKTKARTKAAAAAIIRNAGQHCIEQRQMKKKKKKTVPDRTRQDRADQEKKETLVNTSELNCTAPIT